MSEKDNDVDEAVVKNGTENSNIEGSSNEVNINLQSSAISEPDVTTDEHQRQLVPTEEAEDNSNREDINIEENTDIGKQDQEDILPVDDDNQNQISYNNGNQQEDTKENTENLSTKSLEEETLPSSYQENKDQSLEKEMKSDEDKNESEDETKTNSVNVIDNKSHSVNQDNGENVSQDNSQKSNNGEGDTNNEISNSEDKRKEMNMEPMEDKSNEEKQVIVKEDFAEENDVTDDKAVPAESGEKMETSSNKEEETTKDEKPEEVFTTQVDEETLEAARERQKVADIGRPLHSREKMRDLVEKKSGFHFHRGMKYFADEEYNLAIQSFTKTLNFHPQQLQVYIFRGEAFLQMADFQSAILNYKRACILDPDNFKNYSRLAFIYYLQGQCSFDQKLYPEALEAFSRAAEMRPEVIGYHTRSIACLAALQRHGECLALVNQRLETEHQNADLYVMRARLHQLFKNTTLCYYDAKDALNLNPEHPEAIHLMKDLEKYAQEMRQQATMCSLQQHPRDALQKISIAIDTNPSVAEFHVMRGALHRRVNDFNAAIDDYLLALDKTDHNEEDTVYQEATKQLLLTYNDFAVECFHKNFFDEAILLLNKAIKGEKGEKGLYINRGDCFFKQAELHFALADYHQAMEIDPTDNSVKNRMAIVHYEYGVQAYENKNYKDADGRFTIAIKHNPFKAQYYISRCRVRQLIEDHSGARNDVLMALHLDPTAPEIAGLVSRLFPGKSVRDVLGSRMAATVQDQLQNLVSTASPVILDPIDSSDIETVTSQAASHPSTAEKRVTIADPPNTTTKTADSQPPLAPEMSPRQEKVFNVAVVNEKKLILGKVRTLLHNKQNLRHMGGRLVPLPAPQPPKSKKKEKQKSTGWRKFSSGIGLSSIQDKA